jgi:hypothetical protein
METKYCKECNELKPLSEFYTSQKSLLCKYHHKLRGRINKKKYRQDPKNIEKEKLKSQERKLRLWANDLLHSTKRRNFENTLTVDEILEVYQNQGGLCYWFNVPLIPTLTNKHPQQPSIDRLDRFKGYTKDNVVLTCYAANIGRNETSVDIWQNFISLLFNGKSEESKLNCEITNLKNKIQELDTKDEFVIYDENLNETVVKNLHEYCRQNNINQNTLRSARKKIKRNVQKGLIVLNRSKNETIEKRVYKLTSPNGDVFNLTSLRNFCVEHNLNDSVLHRVGKGELKHYKGWKCEYKILMLD